MPLKFQAQNYPINITTQLVPPFSGYLPDYASAGEEKLKILLLLTDMTKPQYNVKLKISIQGQGISIQSKSFFFDGPLTLHPGIPFELSGHDLYNLLNSQNLDFSGITRAQYEQKKVLPEGFYTICVTAYDYNNPTPIAVSNNSCTQAWMVLSDPPFLNLPLCASTVTISNPQQQTFSFTQMNMGSPNSAANTEYVFELWEIRPQGAVANNIVQTVPPIFTYTTNQTVINYGITEPPLLIGMQYAWRVKAQDITGRDYFKNNGYSQVCTFTYGNILDNADINLNIRAQAVSQRQIKVWWDSLDNFSSYKMEFRKAGSNGNWFPVATPNCHVRVLDLEPQTNYEFHVQGLGDNYVSPFSSITNATTQPMPNYQCGELPAFLTNTNFVPLQAADTGMWWRVGQFDMRVVSLSNTLSQTGVYTGYGRLKMPYAGFVYGSFKNITVDNEHNVVQGRVDALTTGVDAWVDENSVGTVQDGTPQTDVHTSGALNTGDISANTGDGTVIVNGTTYTYTPDGLTIQDGNSNLFIVTADGQVINAGTAGNGHGPVPESKNFIVIDKGVVAFNASAKQLYGTDKYKYPSLVNYYLTVRNLTSGEHDPVNWKSVMAQKYDVVDLSYQLQGLSADSILFRTGTGTIYKPQSGSTGKQLYLVGGKHGDVQELFACYRYSKDSLVNIAKLNIVSYKEEKNKVTLIPLGGNTSIDKTQLKQQLNDIFKQGVASWEVDIAPTISAGDTLWDKDNNGRLNVGSDFFSRYSDEMKAINKYVRAQGYYKKSEYFLVVTNKPADSLMTGLLGEMPRGRNIGYVFTTSPTATVVAHELAHGAFALEHSFDGNASLVRGSSACLMDYNNGTELYKGKYWDYIHNPTTIVGALEGDDDGQIVVGEEIRYIYRLLNRIKEACIENKPLVLMNAECNRTRMSNEVYVGGHYYKTMVITMPSCIAPYTSCLPKKEIKKETTATWDPNAHTTVIRSFVSVDNTIKIYAPQLLLDSLIMFLKAENLGKNLLIFANGYRPNISDPLHEHPKEDDVVNYTDQFGYWGGIDALFTNRIGTRNVVYADGHQTVQTSNHNSEWEFVNNYADWFCFAGKLPSVSYYYYLTNLNRPACMNLYHDSATYKLHRISNPSGFQTRRSHGKSCGLDLISKIISGTIPFDPKTDTIDIVSHSMGHAYALGIIDALSQSPLKFKLGRFYSLAPENPGAATATFDFTLFQEVWQYGSNEKNLPWEQDGVAPQCAIPGITGSKAGDKVKKGRIFFPAEFDPKDYLESHSIVKYFWIFLLKPDNPFGGYVKPR